MALKLSYSLSHLQGLTALLEVRMQMTRLSLEQAELENIF